MLPEEQLQRLYLAGFDLQTFDRFPKAIGVLRDGCVAFLVPGPDGLQIRSECFLKNSYSAFTLPASTCKLLIAFPRPSVSCAMAASPFWFPVLMACRSLAMSAGAWARAWARWWSAVAERSSCISKRFWRRPRNESRRWSASGMT